MGRLLLIDDGLESDAVRWFFQSKELETQIVKDATAGLELVRVNPPDTVIVSSSFGVDFISHVSRTLRANPNTDHVRLIALIDSSDRVDRLPIDAVLMRPFHLDDLYALIHDRAPALPD